MAKMIGAHCPTGPGGKHCPCCGQAPGPKRRKARRTAKRIERRNWRRDIP